MLSLKNPFAKTTQATSALASAPAAEDLLKGKQLLRGRTRARVDALNAQVEDARQSLVDAKQIFGERVGNGEDVTSIMRTVRQAHDRLDALEAALAVAIQKDESAQVDLKEAERVARIEAKVVDWARARSVAIKFDTWLAEGKLLTEELAVSLDVVKSSSEDDLSLQSQQTDIRTWIKPYVHRSCAAVIPAGRASNLTLDTKRFSELFPDSESVRSRTREDQRAAKPIPDWRAGS